MNQNSLKWMKTIHIRKRELFKHAKYFFQHKKGQYAIFIMIIHFSLWQNEFYILVTCCRSVKILLYESFPFLMWCLWVLWTNLLCFSTQYSRNSSTIYISLYCVEHRTKERFFEWLVNLFKWFRWEKKIFGLWKNFRQRLS